MSTKVLLLDQPHRTLALATDDYALIFRHSHPGTDQGYNSSTSSLALPGGGSRPGAAPRCMVEFSPRSALDLQGYRIVISAKGTLGLITLSNDVFLCVVTGSSEVATVRPNETVQKIYGVEFYCLNRSEYDHGTGYDTNPFPGQNFSVEDLDYASPDQSDNAIEHPFHALKKLLSTGNFYYSVDFDLTRRLQDRAEAQTALDISSLDEGLLWNSYMISPLLQFRSRLTNHEREALDHSRMLTSVIRGFVKTLTVPPSSAPLRRNLSHYPSTLTVISRLSSRRAGTRFNSRGADDDGNVANFVETETVFWSPTGICFSYTQIRGSVPVFWESSTSLIPGQQKITLTRSVEATQPAFDKHFDMLERTYGAVHIVNLLSASKSGEAELTQRYRYHISKSPLRHTADSTEASDHHLLRETEFDFHERVKAAGGYEGASAIRPYIESSEESFVYFLVEEAAEKTKSDGSIKDVSRPTVVMQQTGVFRVNCLDCLDRTNVVQGLISKMALELFLTDRHESSPSSDFWMRHSSLWADNGDTLSKIYAGTGALKSSFTRTGKMTLAGTFADARKAAHRLYVNNFTDSGRQNTIDLLLGRLLGQAPVQLYDPVNDFVTAELARRAPEYTSSEPVYLWCGTFNLNGKTTGVSEDLSPWLHAKTQSFALDYDIVAIGFQEIVELSPQQIMSTDPAHRALWENAVRTSLNANPHRLNAADDYVLLRSGQLVGAALMVFVKASVLPRIKNVEGSIKKTGMSGIAGNKGAVAIRFDVASSSVCIVTAHLAAGFGNYEERNHDYRTISTGLRFQKNRGIEDHDSIVWLGDFNYRIGLLHERATKLVEARDLETLYENDQLNIQMVAGMVFPFYSEMRIHFPPTYKFDLGSDNYDSSEKNRIPAWTDRVLRKGVNLRQLEYGCCSELKFSDHRPVYATFELGVVVVDETIRGDLMRRIEQRRRDEVAGILLKGTSGGRKKGKSFTSEKTLSGDEAVTEEDDEGSEASADADDLMGYESIAEGLPPASSDKRKWWLDGEKAVRSSVGPPRQGMVLNGRRPGNPWREGGGSNRRGGEDDWVEVGRSSMATATSMWEGEEGRRGSAGSATGTGTGSGNGSQRSKTPPPLPAARGARRMVVPTWDSSSARQVSETLTVKRIPSSASRSGSGSRSRGPTPTPPPHYTPANNTPLSRAASTASTLSQSNSKKQPPPKPTKPPSLASIPSQAELTRLRSNSASTTPSPPQVRNFGRVSPSPDETTAAPPPLPRRANTVSSSGSGTLSFRSAHETPAPSYDVRKNTPPPVQPRRVSRLQGAGTPSSRPSSVLEGGSRPESPALSASAEAREEEGEAPPPPLPPRRDTGASNAALMDDVADAMGEADGWKPLLPR